MNNSTLIVENPEIPVVMDTETRNFHTLAEVAGGARDKAIQQRMAIKEGQVQGQPRYVCAECFVPVTLLMHHKYGRFYFKHTLEDGRCSAITRGELSHSEINARKYNGAKESGRHIRMKELVEASLRADPWFSDITKEERWKGKINGTWRQPDVQAFYSNADGYGGTRIAFEIQLSTTFLDVIAERRLFYLGEQGLLFWIFAEFPEDGRKLTQDDVFFNNNQNAFIVDEETAATSVASGEFHLKCIWAEPGSTELRRKLVSIRELKLEPSKQQVFYYDFYSAQEVLKQSATQKTAPLQERFETAWMAWASDNEDIGKVWGTFYREFRANGVPLPYYPRDLHPILLNALYSAKYGRVVGWNYNKFIEVAHRIATGHKNYMRLFRHALEIYKRGEQIISEDKSGKWAARAKSYKKAMREGDPAYEPDTTHYEVLAFLFPELFASGI